MLGVEQAEPQVRRHFREVDETGNEVARAEGGDAGDGQFRPAHRLQHVVAHIADPLQRGARHIGDALGLGRELDAASDPPHQGDAEPVLQIAQMVADGGMGDAEFVGGKADAAGLGEGGQGPERIERRQVAGAHR